MIYCRVNPTFDVLAEHFALGELSKAQTRVTNRVGRYESPKNNPQKGESWIFESAFKTVLAK